SGPELAASSDAADFEPARVHAFPSSPVGGAAAMAPLAASDLRDLRDGGRGRRVHFRGLTAVLPMTPWRRVACREMSMSSPVLGEQRFSARRNHFTNRTSGIPGKVATDGVHAIADH